MHVEQRFTRFYALADFFDAAKSNGEIDRVILALPTATEKDGSAADCFGIDLSYDAGSLREQRMNDRCAMQIGNLFQGRSVTILSVDKGNKFFPCCSVTQPRR